ncbi:MAG: alpha/beta fold hydrolase [Candidatus Binatia bacterium]
MAYCTVNGIKIHYEISGEGFPLVLVHANPFDRRLWMYQVAHFSTFFKVVNVDLRGYGYSDKPTSRTSIVEMGEDIVGVCRQEGALEAVVAGISVGGVIALQLGLDHPEIFKALVLVGCSSGPGNRYQERIEGYRQGVERYHIRHLRALVSNNFSESRIGRYLLNHFTEWDKRLHASAIEEIFKALQKREVTHRLGELEMPVLVINGEFDNALPRSREMARKIRGASHHMIPGTGHACCLEDPAAFDETVIEFFKRVHLMPENCFSIPNKRR